MLSLLAFMLHMYLDASEHGPGAVLWQYRVDYEIAAEHNTPCRHVYDEEGMYAYPIYTVYTVFPCVTPLACH